MATKIDNTTKKRVQALMKLNGTSYEEWLNEQHQHYLLEKSEIIDRLLAKELERKKQGNHNQ
ncbi:hypothetical protein FOV01_13320 (plasmid) [Enterococcus faecalis]|uniref:hypothetical protein n=1 Tax=Enterococcus faecalis TaxID=1351 RepID=UPI0011853BD2|nr:hypothetical protein [Enterococcus faecalis]QDR53659.1 hypothetical protein FOV01_13320 [Enterococcus faecalis]